MPNMRIWVDTLSGTWGMIEKLRIVEISPEELDALMERMSNKEICEFGDTFGSEIP